MPPKGSARKAKEKEVMVDESVAKEEVKMEEGRERGRKDEGTRDIQNQAAARQEKSLILIAQQKTISP